jgi:hypothetical protein
MNTKRPFHSHLAGATPLAIALAYGGGAWLQYLHVREGGVERNEPGFLAHWLRDGTLALPLVLVAVAVAFWLVRRAVTRFAGSPGPGLEGSLATAGGALAAAYVFAVGNPIHTLLFAADHGGHGMSLPVHMLRDGALALPACLLVAAATVAVAGVLRRARAAEWWTAGGKVARYGLVFALAAPAFVLSMQGAEQARALAGPGQPCPTDAPVKRFAVSAIDVNIPLNRFGDHDPDGKMYVLDSEIPAVRAQEASRKVSIGLRDDAIQPLVIRANLGDCVEIEYKNNASGGEYGIHIDGLAFNVASSGDAVGRNTPSSVPSGGQRTYRYYVPRDKELEGTHYLNPGPGYRQAVAHGLFGAIAVEPEGSTYLHPDTGRPLKSGWEAMIKPQGKAAFREYVKVYHEIGDEKAEVYGRDGQPLPTVDPITEAYRPGSRAINYRSEPFMHRLERADDKKASSYNSYTFGDPATPMMRAYSSDPSKIRIIHAGSEMFHVYHLHGGGIRWPQNPHADPNWDYAKTGLLKNPRLGGTNRLDSQSFGPGESYTLEVEGGAGGVQRAVGDLLEHCHIAEHYVAGMWSFWRVYNTKQVDLQPLPDRAAPPEPVDSAGLIGRTMADGTTLTKDNLGEWIGELIPPRGVPRDDEDATVWNWTIDASDPEKPVYLGEPEETEAWPNLPDLVGGHRGQPGDQWVGNRPKILFNPVDGRPAYPLLRPNIGQRPPQTPNGHTGTPFLGNTADAVSATPANPWAAREDGLCPQNAPVRRFNLTSIQLPIPVSEQGTDPTGKIFVLNEDKESVLDGTKPPEPLALRANLGDCVALTLVTEFEQSAPGATMPQSNMHIHHVQFDPQGSDGASAGMVYEQAVRPYKLVDPRMTEAARKGDEVLYLENVDKFQKGVFIGVGLGTKEFEVREITAIDRVAKTVTLDAPLARDHAAGEWAGTEFVQERWYPDVDLDNVFWHDHVDGIHGWGKGLVGQLIVEPPGSTYHDPNTGEEVKSGSYVDIRTNNPMAPGLVDGSFRELALWTIGDNPVTDSTLNLRAEPWSERLAKDADPSLLFSSWRHGDPRTPLPVAYRNDPFVIRTVNVTGNGIDSLHLTGHRFYTESRLRDADGNVLGTPQDSVQYGVSGKFTAILEGGAGGKAGNAGDYLYMDGIGRRFRQGSWGLLRVLPGRVDDLQPLPGTSVPDGPAVPTPTGGRPPVVTSAGRPCPANAPARSFAVSAVDLPNDRGEEGTRSAFVPTGIAADVRAGRVAPEPLVLHAAAGECVTVELRNERATARASFHVDKLVRTAASSGVNAGYNPEQTIAPGERRTYRYFADSEKIGSAAISDFGDLDSGARGLYGAFVVAPTGAQFADPRTGLPRDVGAQVDVRLPNGDAYRDFSLILFDNDAVIGANTMPYPTAVDGPALVNYRSEPRPADAMAFSSEAHGDPSTPILQAHVGDAMRVHMLGAPGSEQPHVLSMGGLRWSTDPRLPGANTVEAAAVSPWTSTDVQIIGGAGGQGGLVGDMWYGDLRRPFTEAGMWGLLRVLPAESCDVKRLDGAACGPRPEEEEPIDDSPKPVASPSPSPSSSSPAPARTTAVQPAPAAGTVTVAAATPAAAAAAPATAPAPAAPKVTRLRDLVARRSLTLRALRRAGLAFQVTVPDGTRALRVQLLPSRGKGRSTTVLAAATVRLTADGAQRVEWRLPTATVKRLAAGRYLLRVQAGRDARSIGPERLERTLALRAPR